MAQNTNEDADISAHNVAKAFLDRYYQILDEELDTAYKFYKDTSIMVRPGSGCNMLSFTTIKDINEGLMSFEYNDWTTKIESFQAQDSINGSVIVGVVGVMSRKEGQMKKFSQTFFLAIEEKSVFYVHNDILQFIDIELPSMTPSAEEASENTPISSLTQGSVVSPSEPVQVPENEEKHVSPPKKEMSDVKERVSDVAEAKKTVVLAATKEEPKEEVKRVSYASIVAKASTLSPPPQAAAPATVRVLPKKNQQPSAAAPKPPTPPTKAPVLAANGTPSNGAVQNNNVTGDMSVHIDDLPSDVTHQVLLEAVKQFGPVRPRNIQIKQYEHGFRYAFVEFDNSNSARNAIEAKVISWGSNRTSPIKPKRSSIKGGNYRYRMGNRNDNFNGQDGDGRNGGRFAEHENRSYPAQGNRRNGNFRDQAQGASNGRNGETAQKRF